MMPMSLTEIAQAVDGRLMPTTVPTDEPVAISAFTDSRQIVPGSVFVAIAGERVDGRDFVPKVGAQGAAAALVDHEIAGAQVPQIVVENTVKALGALAKHNIERRRALESPFTVIGIPVPSAKPPPRICSNRCCPKWATLSLRSDRSTMRSACR